MITQDELIKIRENLPSNHLKTLFETLKGQWSKSLIEKVLRGDRNNDEILDAAIELAHINQCKKIALQERINTLT
ncbi:MAG: hypothetical protein IH597_15120 [Bacteroidales bacterium]|nr:hypothetical protein [Bacteroidales bacterium]